MLPISVTFEADFDSNGSYETDLTAYLNSLGGGFRTNRSMDSQGRYQVSTFSVGLDNTSGAFTPDYALSPFFGKLQPDVPVRLRVLHNAISYVLWTGYVEEWKVPSFGLASRCEMTCQDLMGIIVDFSPLDLTVATRLTGAAMTAIATQMGLVAGDYDFDPGIQSLPVHYARQQDARDAANQVVMSEMGGRDFIGADGKWYFEDRHHRLGTAVDQTWGDGTNVKPSSVSYRLTTAERISSVSVQASVYTLGQADQQIFYFSRGMHNRPADSLLIAAGASYGPVEINYEDLAIVLTAPVAINDYLGNTAIDGTGTDKTGALTVTVTNKGGGAELTIKNTDAGGVYVTKFRLRGQPSTFAGQQPVYTATKSVSGMKALRGVTLSVPFADDSNAARDYSVATLRTYRYPYPRATLNFKWASDEIAVAMLTAEIGDLVRFTDLAGGKRASNLDDWFYVEGINHTVSLPGDRSPRPFIESVVTLIPSYLYRNLDALAFDNFSRANVSGDLGTASSGDVWANDTGFDIVSNAARPNSTALQVPNVAVA